MAFCSPKAYGGIGGVSAAVGRLFLFASDVGFPLSVGRMEVRPTSLRMAVFASVTSPADLLRVKKR